MTVGKKAKSPPVKWSEIPQKKQLILLVLCRFSEPLTMSSLRSYMYYQLKSFDPNQSDASVAAQAGYLAAAFTFGQFLTAMTWGKAADSEYFGRKKVLLIGLLGTVISSVGFGFSQTFWVALVFRFAGGLLNGNVGVIRTMVSEMVKKKKYHARAFMLLPMTGNIGNLMGPLIGGFLADPINSYPGLFGRDSLFGGADGVWWMRKWPYALPNLVSACFLAGSALVVVMGLQETHLDLCDRPDWGIELRKKITAWLCRGRRKNSYLPLPADDNGYQSGNEDAQELLVSPSRSISAPARRRSSVKLPWRRMFTRSVIITIFSRGVLAMHLGTWANLLYIFLSTPREKHANANARGLHFTGGLGMPPSQIGITLSIVGCIGIFVQLVIYPQLTEKLGTMASYRTSLLVFPVVYAIAPFIVLLPSSTKPPLPATGFFVWAGMLTIFFFHVLGRTFAVPSATILVNNCCPHPSVLGSVHGLAQSITSGMNMLGPLFGGTGFALALQVGVVGLPFWVIMILSGLACLLSLAVREGDGHEIKLEGDEDEEPLVAEATDEETNTEIEYVEQEVSGGISEAQPQGSDSRAVRL